jgi:hypothetical protein
VPVCTGKLQIASFEAERAVMGIILSLPFVAAEAILPANAPGGNAFTAIMMLAGAVLGGCLGSVLSSADPIDDL